MKYDFYDEFEDCEDYDETEEEEIEMRETELNAAVSDMLEVFLVGSEDEAPFDDGYQEMTDFLKEWICEWLYRKCDISVYRPMYLENENGEYDYEEFPYYKVF